MDIKELWAEARERFGPHTQKHSIVGNALALLEEALGTLRSHGVNLNVERGEAQASLHEWPKMYVKEKEGGGLDELVVNSPEMASALSEGWRPNTGESPKEIPPTSSASPPLILGVGKDGNPALEENEDE